MTPRLVLFRHDNPPASKKTKKSALKNANPLDFNDQATLNRRAERFQREHEIERQKGMKNGSVSFHGGQVSLKANYPNAHVSNGRDYSRMSSPSNFGNPDDPEADPVCFALISQFIVGICH
jgi:hypothetical protein